jgi:hypothetical protein
MWESLNNDMKKNKQTNNSLCMFTKFTTKQIIGDMKRIHYKSLKHVK